MTTDPRTQEPLKEAVRIVAQNPAPPKAWQIAQVPVVLKVTKKIHVKDCGATVVVTSVMPLK